MARWVLLEFEDNDKAKAFVQRVNGDYAYVEMGEGKSPGIRVRAVWGMATLFCQCQRSSHKMFAFRRALKSGWWVHDDCGRPTRAWARGVHWHGAIGRNLLPGNDDGVLQGWGVPDPNDRSGAKVIPTQQQPTERGQAKALRRRNRKRTINPRRV